MKTYNLRKLVNRSKPQNTGKEIRVVWRNFSTLQRRNKLKLDKRRTILHQIQCIIIFDFFYVDHSIFKPGIATQHNMFNLALAAIQHASKSLVGRGNIRKTLDRSEVCILNLHWRFFITANCYRIFTLIDLLLDNVKKFFEE